VLLVVARGLVDAPADGVVALLLSPFLETLEHHFGSGLLRTSSEWYSMRRLWGITIETQAGGRAIITMKLYSPSLHVAGECVRSRVCVCGECV